MNDCSSCLKRSIVLTEDEWKSVCTLSDRESMECMTGIKDHFIKSPEKEENDMMLYYEYKFETEKDARKFIKDLKDSGTITDAKADALYEEFSEEYRLCHILPEDYIVSLSADGDDDLQIHLLKNREVEEVTDDSIDWDKVKTFCKFFLIGGVCYILGKKRCRYKTLRSPLDAIKIMSSDGMDDKEIDAVNRFIFHLNDTLNKEHLAIVRDKKWRKR